MSDSDSYTMEDYQQYLADRRERVLSWVGHVTGGQYIATEWLGVALCGLLLACRLFVRVHVYGGVFKRKSWRWSDILLMIAFLFYVSNAAFESVLNHLNRFNLFIQYFPEEPDPDQNIKNYNDGSKIYYAGQAFYLNTTNWVKLSMLCLYTEFTPISARKTLSCIRYLFIYVLVGMAVITIYWYLGQCWPIYLNWDVGAQYSDVRRCRSNFQMWLPQVIHQVTSDILVWCLPFSLLPYLKFRRSEAATMFGLGGISVVSSLAFQILYLGMLHTTSKDVPVEWAWRFLRIIDIGTAVAVACLPGVRSFVRHFGFDQVPCWSKRKARVEAFDSQEDIIKLPDLRVAEGKTNEHNADIENGRRYVDGATSTEEAF